MPDYTSSWKVDLDSMIILGHFQLEIVYDSEFKLREENFIVEQLHSANEKQCRDCFAELLSLFHDLNSSVLVYRGLQSQGFGKDLL